MGVTVELDDVTREFPNGRDRLEVLRGVTIRIASGEAVAIVGESGCGKSTLLSVLGGLDLPSSGAVRVAGERVDTYDDEALSHYRSRTVGLVFQFHYLLRDFTTLENIMLPALVAGSSRDAARTRALDLMDRVGIGDCAQRLTPQLSGGERQRAAIARALINAPPLLLADEPTGNLDDANSLRVQELLYGLARAEGMTLVVVTHSRDLAAAADRTLRLEAGCLLAS